MTTWAKVQNLAQRDPWLIEALEISKFVDDERPLQKRVKESIAFIAFRPFEKADPEWEGQGEFHPMFHNSRAAGSDGVYYWSYPVVVYHYGGLSNEGISDFHFSHLLPASRSSCTVRQSMQWYVGNDSERDGHRIVFDAIVKPLHVRVNPHGMIAESYEIYKFPSDFDFTQWYKGGARAPIVHGLVSGLPLCDFTDNIPLCWPLGHSGTEGTDPASMTCTNCKRIAKNKKP